MSESTNPKQDEINKAMFVHLVLMLSSSAMQQMGKLVNPAIGKTQINLEGAQFTIDILDALAAKTKGNLDKDEQRLMTETLTTLKMNFVETKESKAAEAKSDKAQPATPPADEKKTEPGKDEPPKFHKTYS